MTMTGLTTFDDTIHTTNTWLHEITSRMGWDERQRGYRLLRLSLHAIRDRLSVAETAHLSAQLPLLIRGIFFEGWQPMRKREGGRDIASFLADIRAAFSDDPAFDAEAGFREVISVMRLHVSAGEMEDIARAMPDTLKPLWEEP
jgi:uncharacterized protein (DUF2267 family)